MGVLIQKAIKRIVEPVDAPMTPQVARYMLKLKLDDEQRDRISKLTAKANKGTLTIRERAELEQYLLLTDLLTMLHLKARLVLKTRAA